MDEKLEVQRGKELSCGRQNQTGLVTASSVSSGCLAKPQLSLFLHQRKPVWFVSVLDIVQNKCLWNLIEIKISTIQPLGVLFVPQQLCLKAAAREIGRKEGTISGIY